MLVGNAHVVAGNAGDIASVVRILEKEGIPMGGNPDAYVRAYKHFGVEEARELRERAALKPLGKRRVFVLAASDINREAQNALLKTLEEPSSDALFVFIVPSPQTLLPTLRSRMQMLSLDDRSQRESRVDVKKFLSATPQQRLDLLKPLLEKGDDDRRDIGAILSFLGELERKLEKNPSGLHATRREGIESVYRARKYITDRGALVKPLLEQVALLVP